MSVGLVLRTARGQLILDVAEYVWRLRGTAQVIQPRRARLRPWGAPLATSQPAFTLIFLPGKGHARQDLEPLAAELSRQLGRDSAELLETLELAVREESAVRLAENLPTKTMFQLSELKTIYPGVDLIIEARRYYPFGRFASHLLGYMGKMSPNEWRELKPKGYRADTRVGKTGLEKTFETELTGRDGGIRMEVDAQGPLKRVLERILWEAGSNIHLTLDAAVQKAADDALRATTTGRGAAVGWTRAPAISSRSAPAFDPNALLSTDPERSSGPWRPA